MSTRTSRRCLVSARSSRSREISDQVGVVRPRSPRELLGPPHGSPRRPLHGARSPSSPTPMCAPRRPARAPIRAGWRSPTGPGPGSSSRACPPCPSRRCPTRSRISTRASRRRSGTGPTWSLATRKSPSASTTGSRAWAATIPGARCRTTSTRSGPAKWVSASCCGRCRPGEDPARVARTALPDEEAAKAVAARSLALDNFGERNRVDAPRAGAAG